MRNVFPWLLLALSVLACSCTEKTETGYDPRKLSMNDEQRRALYASPFTTDANDNGSGLNQDARGRH